MTDNRTISLAIPTWNRNDMLFEAFEKVYDDPRISEIVVIDDCSDLDLFHAVKEKCDKLQKVRLIRNIVNVDCYQNKYRAISFINNDFGILLDSDNSIDKKYIDKLYEIEKWDPRIVYMPSFAMPLFSYEQYAGVTFSKENIAKFIDLPMVSTCLNCMNYFVSKTEYCKVWQSDITPHTADSILQNYNWMVAGNGIFIVPHLSYSHRVHDSSHYKLNNHKTGNLYNEIENKIRKLL